MKIWTSSGDQYCPTKISYSQVISDKCFVTHKRKLHIPIVLKLGFFTALLLGVAAGLITWQSSDRFEQISMNREDDANINQTRARANEVENLFVSYIDKIKIISSLIYKDFKDPAEKKRALDLTFYRDRDLVSVEVISKNPMQRPERVVNEDYLKQYKLNKEYVETLRTYQKKYNKFHRAAVFNGQVEIRNSYLQGGAPLISIGVPIVEDQYGSISHIAIAEVRLDRIQKIFSNVSERLIYLIDKEGHLIAHPDEEKVTKYQALLNIPIVRAALESKVKQKQMKFEDPKSGERFFGAFAKTPVGVSVIAQASEDVILEAVKKVRREAIYIAGKVISLSFLFVFLISISFTAPVEKLVKLTKEITKGNFSVRSNIRTRDEVGELALAFDNMIEGLEERDKVKNMLNKFHGSSVAEDLLKGDLALGGSRKEVTVFFSDIRDFTKFSEGHTPEEVVDMLNEYFQIMVGIINRNGGIVDKFIGDAIMAVWGAPNASERDPFNAVRACLEMRQSLEQLNKARIDRGQEPIKIGMGVHKGFAISGTIGSDERMEYTVIGDAVNQSSRIEASTKAFGTDLLLSDTVAEIVSKEFVLDKAGQAEVKGKSEALKLYKVKGYIAEDGQQTLVRTPYSDFEAASADKVKVA